MSVNTTHIKPAEYQVFYKLVREKFIKEIHNGLPPKNSIKCEEVWNALNERGEFHATLLFSGHGTLSPKYFFRKSQDLNPAKWTAVTIDKLSFLKGLKYIGITTDTNSNKRKKLNEDQEVEILYKIFIEQFKDEIELEVNPIPNASDIYANISLESANHNLISAKRVIENFYKHLANENILEAWELMSPEFQNRKPWLGNFEKFKIGYTNTKSIRNVIVFSANETIENIFECRVFYEDIVSSRTNGNLVALDTFTINDIDLFANHVKKLQEDFKINGLNGFEKIELYKLFEPAVSEYIWYKCNFPPDELDKLFSREKEIVVKRLYDCTCIMKNNSWFINGISAMKSYSAR